MFFKMLKLSIILSLASDVVMNHLASINEVARQLELSREILQVKRDLLKTLGKNKILDDLNFINLFPVAKSSDVFIRVKDNLESRKKRPEDNNLEAVSGLVKRMLKCNIV